MSQLVPLKEKLKDFRGLLAKQHSEIAKAVPKGIDPVRFARTALTLFATRPALLDCTPASVMGAVMQAAAYGLELDPAMGQAYLVPYGNQCQMITGYQGLIALALRSEQVKSVVGRAVYQKDIFDYELGLNERLVHRPSHELDKGELTYVYAVAKLVDADGFIPIFEVMSKKEVDAIRARSKAAQKGPWVTDYELMARKTGVRRLSKWLPKTTDLQAVLAREDRNDGLTGTPGVEELIDDLMREPAIEGTVVASQDASTATTASQANKAAPSSSLDQLTDKLPDPKATPESPAQDKPPSAPKTKPEHDPRVTNKVTPTARDLSRQEQASRHEVARAHQLKEAPKEAPKEMTADELNWSGPAREPGEEG